MRRWFVKFRASMAELSPSTIALIFALGLVLGVFPVFGAPTLLCAAAAILFRLNLPAIQLVNQVCSPLQYALLIPLGRAGAKITGLHVSGNILGSLADTARNAVIGWACFCVPLGLLLYLILWLTLRRRRSLCSNGLESPV
jgi:uncharacterized protein (DUF2062 family)